MEKQQLIAACAVEEMHLSAVVERARTLLAVSSLLMRALSVWSVRGVNEAGRNSKAEQKGTVKCFRCQKERHIERHCEEK